MVEYSVMYTKRLLVVFAGPVGASAAPAQDPARLPAVVVKAPVEKPGPNQVAGVVRDTFALPIQGVEISIPSLQRRALSDSAGKFHVADVRPGKYDIRARRVGFAPQIRQV